LPGTVQCAALDGSEHPFIGVDADGRSGIAEHLIQGLITLVVAKCDKMSSAAVRRNSDNEREPNSGRSREE
jgi:hypothetical protein